jgi:hypothetical protein
MPGKKHVHRYLRTHLRFASVWRCADSECPHFMPPHQEGLMIGRASFCWGCSEQFTLDDEALKEEFPRCARCRAPELVTVDIDTLINARMK